MPWLSATSPSRPAAAPSSTTAPTPNTLNSDSLLMSLGVGWGGGAEHGGKGYTGRVSCMLFQRLAVHGATTGICMQTARQTCQTSCGACSFHTWTDTLPHC